MYVDAIRAMAMACKFPLEEFMRKMTRYESSLGPLARRKSLHTTIGQETKWSVTFAEDVEKLRALVVAKHVSINLPLGMQISGVVLSPRDWGWKQIAEIRSRVQGLEKKIAEHHAILSSVQERAQSMDDRTKLAQEADHEILESVCAGVERMDRPFRSSNYSKGTKGISVRLYAKTETLSSNTQNPLLGSTAEVCFCKIRLFRDPGAERRLSNDIAHIKKTIDKLEQIYVLQDLRPYVCTVEHRDEPTTQFDWRRALLLHGIRWHELEPVEFDSDLLERRLKGSATGVCVFRGERTGGKNNSRENHIGRHMEEIAFAVVRKHYEEWDFYSDSSRSGHYDIESDPHAKRLNQDNGIRSVFMSHARILPNETTSPVDRTTSEVPQP
ncbi:MAG: hypothetical protein Q9217_006099 [Psora testacea]